MDEQTEVHMENPKDYITQEQIMQELGLSKESCWLLISNEFFPSIKLSKKLIIVPLTAYRKFINDPESIIQFNLRNKKTIDVSTFGRQENIDGTN